jgi:hypothetical protein
LWKRSTEDRESSKREVRLNDEASRTRGDTQGEPSSRMDEEKKDWTVAVFDGSVDGNKAEGAEGDETEIELDVDDAVEASKVMGVAVYYSRKN